MAEISAAGYGTVRDLIEGGTPVSWDYIELQTAAAAKVIRGEIGGIGTGATWEAREESGQVLVVKYVVTGTMIGGGNLPVTVAKSVLKATDSDMADELSTETLSSTFEFQELEDQLTVYHKIQVPQLT